MAPPTHKHQNGWIRYCAHSEIHHRGRHRAAGVSPTICFIPHHLASESGRRNSHLSARVCIMQGSENVRLLFKTRRLLFCIWSLYYGSNSKRSILAAFFTLMFAFFGMGPIHSYLPADRWHILHVVRFQQTRSCCHRLHANLIGLEFATSRPNSWIRQELHMNQCTHFGLMRDLVFSPAFVCRTLKPQVIHTSRRAERPP